MRKVLLALSIVLLSVAFPAAATIASRFTEQPDPVDLERLNLPAFIVTADLRVEQNAAGKRLGDYFLHLKRVRKIYGEGALPRALTASTNAMSAPLAGLKARPAMILLRKNKDGSWTVGPYEYTYLTKNRASELHVLGEMRRSIRPFAWMPCSFRSAFTKLNPMDFATPFGSVSGVPISAVEAYLRQSSPTNTEFRCGEGRNFEYTSLMNPYRFGDHTRPFFCDVDLELDRTARPSRIRFRNEVVDGDVKNACRDFISGLQIGEPGKSFSNGRLMMVWPKGGHPYRVLRPAESDGTLLLWTYLAEPSDTRQCAPSGCGDSRYFWISPQGEVLQASKERPPQSLNAMQVVIPTSRVMTLQEIRRITLEIQERFRQ